MRLANLTLEELTEAFNRGWGQRDSRVAMLLQEERAGVNAGAQGKNPGNPGQRPQRRLGRSQVALAARASVCVDPVYRGEYGVRRRME